MTSNDFATNRDNFCYRHRDRQSFVLCQRCLRTICAECQTQAPVGVICPECMKAQRMTETSRQRKARKQQSGFAAKVFGFAPPVTTTLMALTALVGLLQMIPQFGDRITNALLFYTPWLFPAEFGISGGSEVWRVLTAALVHGGILHFALNMFALLIIGRSLEPMLGTWRFLSLYVLSAFGGSLAVALISPAIPVVGASGAIFGLLGTILIIGRKAGANMSGILILLGANLLIGFIPGFNISWEAHVGGAVVGALIGLIFVNTTRPAQRRVQLLLLGILALVLIVVMATVVPALFMLRF